jgi:hypothetical protein
MDNLTKKLLRDGNLVGLKKRPARTLIGWMPKREAQTLLAIPQAPATPLPEHVQRVREAHASVKSRPDVIDQTPALSDTGEEMLDYLAELKNNQAMDRTFKAVAPSGLQT